jgi:hypothetical protein
MVTVCTPYYKQFTHILFFSLDKIKKTSYPAINQVASITLSFFSKPKEQKRSQKKWCGKGRVREKDYGIKRSSAMAGRHCPLYPCKKFQLTNPQHLFRFLLPLPAAPLRGELSFFSFSFFKNNDYDKCK